MRRKSIRSEALSRSCDQAIVARSVCWRGSTSRPPWSESRRFRQALQQLGRPEELQPRCGQLDGEGKPVEPIDERRHRCVARELNREGAGSREQQVDGVVVPERLDRMLVLALDGQPLTTRHEQPQRRTRGDELREDDRRFGEQVLEVVDQQQ